MKLDKSGMVSRLFGELNCSDQELLDLASRCLILEARLCARRGRSRLWAIRNFFNNQVSTAPDTSPMERLLSLDRLARP